MENKEYPEKINIAKREFDRIGEDDYYDDVIVWEGEPKDDKHVGYVRADLVPQWHDASKELPNSTDNVMFILKGEDYGYNDIHIGIYKYDCISKEYVFEDCQHNGRSYEGHDVSTVEAWMYAPKFNTNI